MPRGVNMYDEGRIQQRNFSASDNIQIISPGTITEGLVRNYDAGNYASYPASGTVWRDLCGPLTFCNISGSPTYSPANGGTFSFTGSTQYADSSANLTLGNNAASLSVWVKHSSTTTPTRQRYLNLGSEDFVIRSNSGTLQTYITLSGTIRTLSGSATDTNWSHIVATWDGSVLAFYRNAVQMSTSTPPAGSLNASLSSLIISHPSTEYMNGNISSAAVYNRALSPQEIAQNFNATRARFGV